MRSFSFPDENNLTAFLLQYSGLTWEHLSEVVLSTLGQGNVAAVETIAGWFDNISTSDPLSMFRFLQDLPNKAATLGLSIDLSEVWNNLESRATSVLTSSLSTMTTRLATLFVPGAGTIRAIYNGLSWLSNNMQQLSGLFNGFVDALLGTDANDVKTKLLATFNSATETLVSFAAAQLGLSKLPGELRKVLSYVPQRVDAGMRKLLADVAGKVRVTGGSGDEMFKGIVSEKKEFDYGGKNYVLWAVQSGTTVKVKLAEKVNGQWKLIAELKDANFTTTAAKGDYTALFGKAKSLADATKPNAQNKNPAAIAALASLSTQVKSAENTLAGDANACGVLNAGCFAAGTKLWTPDGYRNVEEIEEGEMVYARDEWDPNGAIEAKVVEKKFERTGRILHLHVNGEVIRTTPEHPFFDKSRGWIEAGALQEGDEVRTDSGWATVEDVFDTGEYETVYNLRVAEHHTYFVGEECWGWCAWAHNTYDQFKSELKTDLTAAGTLGGGVNGAWARKLYDVARVGTNEAWYEFSAALSKKSLSRDTIRTLWWLARDQDPAFFVEYVPSTVRPQTVFETSQVLLTKFTSHPLSLCDHRLAILVHQGSDPTPPYQALVIRESAMLFRGFAPWGHKGVLGSRTRRAT